MRPIAALSAGVLADRLRPSRVVIAAFFVIAAFASFSMAVMSAGGFWPALTELAAGSPLCCFGDNTRR